MKIAVKYWQKLKDFIFEAYGEFKKVNWPSRDKAVRLTVLVIGVSLVVALFVWIVDILLKEGLSNLLIG